MLPRNKAKLRDGAIVEYDEAMDFDPENPEPRKPKTGWETEYLGVGEIVEARGIAVDNGGKLYHFWKFPNASNDTITFTSLVNIPNRFKPF